MIGKPFDRIYAMKNMATNKERKLIEGLEGIEPDELVYMSITELASRLKVAEATVVRFCKKLGYNGFQDFKLSLSKELGTVARSDMSSVVKRIAQQMTDAITDTSYSLQYDKCLEIAGFLVSADKIGAFGVGNSSVTAMEIGNVLARIGINVTVTPDPHMQAMITSNMTDRDIVFLISVSGSTSTWRRSPRQTASRSWSSPVTTVLRLPNSAITCCSPRGARRRTRAAPSRPSCPFPSS